MTTDSTKLLWICRTFDYTWWSKK